MRRDHLILHLALFFSGAAGLIYESSWTRLLHRVFGVGDLAVATVLATFFLGLGLGNALAARFIPKVKKPARAYAILEVAVGVYALLSLAIVPGLGAAYGALGPDSSFATLTLVRFSLAALALLPPTMLMGATLPVVAEAAKDLDWSRSVTAFYTSNTLGAVAGAALAGFVLVPQLGTKSTVIVGAVLSFVAAIIVLVGLGDATRASLNNEASEVEGKKPEVHGPGGHSPLALAAVLTCLSGAAALGSEVLWTRVLRIVVHGTTPAFAAMLVNYLLGIALGALIARALSKRFHPALILGVSQTLLVALTGLAMALVPFAPRLIPMLRGELDTVPNETWIIGVVSGALLLPLATVLGTGLPATWAMVSRSADAGRGSAVLLAANTMGGLVGSLCAGFFLVPLMGSEASLLAFAAINALVAAVALRSAAPSDDSVRTLGLRIGGILIPLLVFGGVLALHPSIELRFLLGNARDPVNAMVHGPSAAFSDPVVYLREGRSTTVSVLRSGHGLSLYNDGRPESGFSAGSPGFGPELVALGGLPGVLAAERDNAMVIGLGGGHTAAMALASGFEHVRVIELEEGVVEASRLLYSARQRPHPLDDPRAQLVVDDARNQLNLMPADSLDAVMSQPSHPWLAGSSALYTIEFFREVDHALRPGGVFGLWVNLFRMDIAHLRSVVRTLTEVFPHVNGFVFEGSSLVLMASSEPLQYGPEQETRLEAADTTGPYFAPHDLGSLTHVLAHLEMDDASTMAFGAGGVLIEDDRPLLELELARLPNTESLSLTDLDRALVDQPWLHGLDGLPDATELLTSRLAIIEARPQALTRFEATLPSVDESTLHDAAYIQGALAEVHGNITLALTNYDASTAPRAIEAAANLRFAERMLPALDAAARRPDAAFAADPLLRAALILRPVPQGLADFAQQRAATNDLAAFVVSYLAMGCAQVQLPTAEALSTEFPEVAHVLFRCAYERGDTEAAARYEQRAWRLRTAQAATLTSRGATAANAGNGGLGLMLLTRALRVYPTTTRAAISLAQLHQRDGRPAEAERVLREAFDAAEGLEDARGRIVSAAEGLMIELGPNTSNEGAGETGASTIPMTEMESE